MSSQSWKVPDCQWKNLKPWIVASVRRDHHHDDQLGLQGKVNIVVVSLRAYSKFRLSQRARRRRRDPRINSTADIVLGHGHGGTGASASDNRPAPCRHSLSNLHPSSPNLVSTAHRWRIRLRVEVPCLHGAIQQCACLPFMEVYRPTAEPFIVVIVLPPLLQPVVSDPQTLEDVHRALSDAVEDPSPNVLCSS